MRLEKVSSPATRLERFVASLSQAVASEFGTYLVTVPIKAPSRLPRISQLHTQPHWISFPVALANHQQRDIKAPAIRSTLIHDILSAQYFMYLSVRLKDDLLDGQAAGRTLSEVSHSLERTAVEILRRWFEPSSKFWGFFERYVKDTTEGIDEVERLQRRVRRDPEEMLDGFARTSSIFKIGTAALCVASGKVNVMRTLESILDHLAIGGQIVDDIRDMVEDLECGRYNHAVQMLLKGNGQAVSRLEASQHLLSALLNPRSLEEVVSVAVYHFKAAHVLLKRLRLHELYGIPVVQQRAAENLIEQIHHRRMRVLFGRNESS